MPPILSTSSTQRSAVADIMGASEVRKQHVVARTRGSRSKLRILFFGSEKGGKTAATLYTLVQSARRNCVDVWPYLTDVLRRIAAIAPNDTAALEALLPNCWVAVHPEHRLEQREEESREAQARRRRKRVIRRAVATV